MAPLMTRMTLKTQNRRFAGTGGISPANRGVGFLPAFLDQETGRTYLSCNADGSLAPIHRLDGLPDEVILACTPRGPGESGQGSPSRRFYPGDSILYARTGSNCRGLKPFPSVIKLVGTHRNVLVSPDKLVVPGRKLKEDATCE